MSTQCLSYPTTRFYLVLWHTHGILPGVTIDVQGATRCYEWLSRGESKLQVRPVTRTT